MRLVLLMMMMMMCFISTSVAQDYLFETFQSDDRALVKLPQIVDVYENGEVKTSKCGAAFLKTKFDDFGSCVNQVEALGVTCGAVKAKLACLIILATGCLGTVDSQNLWNYMSEKEIERFRNSGQLDMVSQCDEIKTFQSDLMGSVFGSQEKCTFDEGKQLIKARNQCQSRAIAAKNEKVNGQPDFRGNEDLSSKDPKYYEAYCDLEKDWMQCYEETIFTCASQEKIGSTKEREFYAADTLEIDIQKSGLDDFSFQNCPHRPKEDQLTDEQQPE